MKGFMQAFSLKHTIYYDIDFCSFFKNFFKSLTHTDNFFSFPYNAAIFIFLKPIF